MRFEIYVDLFHQYRWRLVNEHGVEIAVSPEGYYNKVACQRYVELVCVAAGAAPVCDRTQETNARER